MIYIETRFQGNAFSLYFWESIERECIKRVKKHGGWELPTVHADTVGLAFKRSLGCLECHLMFGDRVLWNHRRSFLDLLAILILEKAVKKKECRTQILSPSGLTNSITKCAGSYPKPLPTGWTEWLKSWPSILLIERKQSIKFLLCMCLWLPGFTLSAREHWIYWVVCTCYWEGLHCAVASRGMCPLFILLGSSHLKLCFLAKHPFEKCACHFQTVLLFVTGDIY